MVVVKSMKISSFLANGTKFHIGLNVCQDINIKFFKPAVGKS